MKPIRLLAALFLAWTAFATTAPAAESLRPQFLLTGASSREHQSLSGQWTYSKDLYKQGLT